VGAQTVRSYRSFQGNESRVLALNLLESPADYVQSIERYSTSVVSIVGWGRRISENNDYVLGIALSFVQNGAGFSSPGQFLAESYPWLCKLPAWLYPLPSILWNEGQRSLRYFYALSLEGSRSKVDCFSKHLLKSQEEYGLNYKEVASLTGNLIGGGVDTTSTSTITFIFAMCIFPEVQRKAQEELDRVIPNQDRFPNWVDEEKLPYISALVTENFRWRSAIVLGGPPHAPIKDDVYNGYLIPKGTTLIGNLWAIHRNPKDYPNPDEFRPERWLDEDEYRPRPTKRGIFTFGWGRRACSGQPLAEQGIWFTIAELLFAFEMRAIDKDVRNPTHLLLIMTNL
jgi:cytochrome P450